MSDPADPTGPTDPTGSTGSAGSTGSRPGSKGRSRFADVPWTLPDSIAVLVLGTVLGTILGFALLPDGADLAGDDAGEFAPVLLAQPIAYIVAVFGVVGLRHPQAFGRLMGSRRPGLRHVAGGIGLGVGGFLLSNLVVGGLITAIFTLLEQEPPAVQQEFQAAAGDPTAVPFLVLGAAVLAPIGEELAFRGMLYPALARRLPRGAAIWVSAIVFALAHPAADLLGYTILAATLLPFGALLAWAYERSGTLLVPFLGHLVFNAIGVTAMLGVAGMW
ncbi:CPBP family intramembrane glutamic endopeptidase [Egibacter rhizosphaerae]|uniref:CPBP family intramembrane glutamic endopeptidase n=1 Tax=Egibacter rhizosphaerae TaxID=1670831 RepID=UPI0013F16108|nr:type II CAAX endopeptidase family protein [Egibacter rhizosphaerae]